MSLGIERKKAEKEKAMGEVETFTQYRPLLFSIAYRMLGTVVDAEDMVQETFLRWQQTSEVTVQSAKTYLATIITRLCINHLRSARVQREQYIGSWLPEPLVTPWAGDPADVAELNESLATAFLVLLESLSPTERAVFLLHEVFDYDYPEIGQIVGKNPANCRQILRRARQHLEPQRPRFHVSPEQRQQLTLQFIQAWNAGDLQGLLSLLAKDVTSWSDGGGKVRAALKPLHDSRKVARFLLAIRRSRQVSTFVPNLAKINGQPGIINYVNGCPWSVITFDIAQSRIQSLYIVVNPDKMKRVSEGLSRESPQTMPRCSLL